MFRHDKVTHFDFYWNFLLEVEGEVTSHRNDCKADTWLVALLAEYNIIAHDARQG
jgi:hypothetical protein